MGCGLETLWFNLMEDEGFRERDVRFVELDLPSVAKKKIKKIEKSKLISNLISKSGLADQRVISGSFFNILEDFTKMTLGDKYFLSGCDLSNLHDFQERLK